MYYFMAKICSTLLKLKQMFIFNLSLKNKNWYEQNGYKYNFPVSKHTGH